ncbi:ATP-binding protein [Phaeobacter sp. C3_T13_0]|uniref:ATP-binding protein n=1 Tax=Phaeobacter cretensis TaxID=3342641 RepID=UPI0039BCCE22
MTIWDDVQLSLIAQPTAYELADCKTTVRVSHPGSSYRRYNPERQLQWPLAELCQAAAQRQQQHHTSDSNIPRIDQVLVMYDALCSGLLTGLQGRVELTGMDVTAAATYGFGRAGHADLLHAVADGFDWVLLAAAADDNARLTQLREMELAACLGLEGRVVLFNSVAHLEQLLTEGISQLPVIAHRSVSSDVSAQPTSRREALQLFASVTLPEVTDAIALPHDAPYGGIELTDDCTLCQSCTWVCPTNALIVDEDGGGLAFVEADCMQCGLCVSMCRQNALRLVPRLEMTEGRVLVSLADQDLFKSEDTSENVEAKPKDVVNPVDETCRATNGPNGPAADDDTGKKVTATQIDNNGPDDWPNAGPGCSSDGTFDPINGAAPVAQADGPAAGRGDTLLDLASILALLGMKREDKLS